MKRYYKIYASDGYEISGWMDEAEAKRIAHPISGAKIKTRPWIVDLFAPMTLWQSFWVGASLAALVDLLITCLF